MTTIKASRQSVIAALHQYPIEIHEIESLRRFLEFFRCGDPPYGSVDHQYQITIEQAIVRHSDYRRPPRAPEHQ